MERSELMRDIRAGHVQGVYLFEGEEEYLKQQALQALKSAVLTEGLEMLNSSTVQDPSAADLIADCETVPMMGDVRLIVVEDMPCLLGKKEPEEELISYIPKVPSSTVLVFYVHGKADSRRRLYKAIGKSGHVVTFQQMDEGELSGWIQKQFKALGKNCSPETAARMVFTVGRDTARMILEIGKVAAFCGERETVTDEDVESVATPSREYKAFAIVDAMMEGSQARVFALVRDMLEGGETRIGIMAMLLYQFRMLQHVAILSYDRVGDAEAMKLLNIKSFVLGRYRRQLSQISGGAVRDSVQCCLDYELKVKSGEIAQEGALEAMLLKLFAIRRGENV
ncbi:MAG: DNA polymerase III subunit delta [Clostridia bacterium]|nr:DNA polymerase III subunit delta [Clostridia bacterium]